jgi:hypothetical protein
MNRAAVARSGLRDRPARTVAALMLAMLVVQFAAQWCAWHCGAVDLLERSPFPLRGDAAATTPVDASGSAGADVTPGAAGPALAASTSDAAASDASTPCGAEAWCELGQTPPLASPAAPVVAHAATAPDPARSAPVAAFLSSPEERPPTA